jgi:hypothetical protein
VIVTRVFAGITLAVAVALATPAFAAERSIEEIQECARKNLPERSARQDLSLLVRDGAGQEQTIEAVLFWKRGDDGRSRVLVRVEAPPDLRGAAFLLVEREGGNDMFSYLPELKKVRRITGRTVSGSLFGTDFSYEDIARLQGLATQAKVEKLADAQVAGRAVWVLTAPIPPESGSKYQRVVSFVDQETCVPLKTELMEGPEQVRKEVVVPPEQVKAEGSRFVPRELYARDLEGSSETRMRVEKLQYDVELSDSFFSETALTKGR